MYIHQGDSAGYSCSLIALLNALRYFGKSTTSPDQDDWQRWLDALGCNRKPMAKSVEEVAAILGLVTERVDPSRIDRFPAYVQVVNPEEVGAAIHAVLCINKKGGELTLVNYFWRANRQPIWTGTPVFPARGNPARLAFHLAPA